MHSSTSNDPTSTPTSGMHINHATLPPSAYTPTRPSQTRRLSSESTSSTMTTSPSSIRRKPVSYLSSEEIPFPPRSNYMLQQGSRAGSSVTLPSFVLSTETGNKQEEDKPPVYILDVDLDVPVPATDSQAEEHQTPTLVLIEGDQSPTKPSTPPPTYAYPPTSPSSSHSAPTLPLPTYTATPSTEPTTLPRQLFTYGFLCPLLWALGAVLLCVPLKVYEEDFDLDFEARRGGLNAATSSSVAGVTEQERAEEEGRFQGMKKRERELLDEKVLILRRAELRWARYCAIAFACFLGVVIVVVAVILFVTRR